MTPPLELSPGRFFGLFWRVKLGLARNHLSRVGRLILFQAVIVSTVMLVLLTGGYFLFEFIFSFLLAGAQQPFGEPIMKRLTGMVLLAFFSMLIFSNLIIMLTTTYISREIDFYMGLPVRHRTLFFCKLAESTLYSSWAFLILSMPLFIALGRAGEGSAPWTYYPAIFAMLVPFVMIPSALGAIFAMLVSRYLPARKMIRLGIGLAAGSVLLMVGLGRFVGLNQLAGNQWRSQIGRVMTFMGFGDVAWMPSTWLARGMRAAIAGEARETFFWAAMLLSTALMALQVCYWLAGRLYYRGFGSSRTSGTAMRTREKGLYGFFDALVRPLRPAVRALVTKDLATFWRDPAQWGQLMVLFGLLVIYIANLGGARELSRIQINVPIWKSMISLGNIGAVCFVLSILSTRFFFPLLSLEGKQQWVIGLAPVGRTSLVWVKYGVCWGCSLALTIPLTLFSCAMLNTAAAITLISLGVVFLMSMGLTALAIGLGAMLPNFAEDNPSRIANGLGGTINIVLSLIYITGSIVLLIPAIWDYSGGQLPAARIAVLVFKGALPAWALFQLAVITLPLALGLRHWRRLEF